MKLNLSQDDLQINDNKKINFYADISIDKYVYLKKNFKNILKEVVNYFKNNTKKFIILKNLYDDNIDYELTLDVINFYCKKYKKDWYRSVCRKYNLRFGDRPILSPLKYSEIIELNYKDQKVKLTLSNLIFFKHFFEDGIYDELEKRLNDIDDNIVSNLESDDDDDYLLISTHENGYKVRGCYKSKDEANDNYVKIKKLENIKNLYVLKRNSLKKPKSKDIKLSQEIFDDKKQESKKISYCEIFLLLFKFLFFSLLLFALTILVEKDNLFSDLDINLYNDQIKKYLFQIAS
jgi:hypothetical protein